uniref:Uncharacterized protein n=1 Tax=Caenorhabditis japonica TaxID=281687 RepID=A0A8R1EQC2_CAEJA
KSDKKKKKEAEKKILATKDIKDE